MLCGVPRVQQPWVLWGAPRLKMFSFRCWVCCRAHPNHPCLGRKTSRFPCFLRNTACVQTKRLCNSVLKHSLSVREEGGGDL